MHTLTSQHIIPRKRHVDPENIPHFDTIKDILYILYYITFYFLFTESSHVRHQAT